MSNTISNEEICSKIYQMNCKLEDFGDSSKIKDFGDFLVHLNPRTTTIPYLKKIFELQKQKFLKDEAYFCRSDLLGDVARIMCPPKNYDKIIKELKGLLDEKDIGALLFASEICEKEDSGEGEDLLGKGRLKGAFKKRGVTLYNWLRSWDVFPEDIFPLLRSRKNFPNDDSFKVLFRKNFEDLLEFHHDRIFVSPLMSKKDLESQINRRACFYDIKKIIVYSRSGRNQIASQVLNKKENYFSGTKFSIVGKKYKLGNSYAMKFELTKIEEDAKEIRHRKLKRLRPWGIIERKKAFQEKNRKFEQKEEKRKMNKILSLFKNK